MSYDACPARGPVAPNPDKAALLEHVGSEPVGRHPTGAEILDDRICVLDQPQEHVATRRGSDVERDGAFAAIGVLEGERRLPFLRRSVTVVVAGSRALDLDHVGAEVGEDAGREGPGDDAREIQHPNSLEDAPGHGAACYQRAE